MRTAGIPIAALLLVLYTTTLQVSAAGDIYWEGEEDASNEFLEVKHDDDSSLFNLKRFKREWTPWKLFSFGENKDDKAETVTEPENGDDGSSFNKDDDQDFGSGYVDRTSDQLEPKEKTLRVSFTVIEPYRMEYSNRDSPEFLDFSHSLANAVDALFEKLSGTQKSSLVRIQSLIHDEFSCKVTLDIVTTGYDDTDTIEELLKNHIKNNGRLGKSTVTINGFNAKLIDPASGTDLTVGEPAEASTEYSYPVDNNNPDEQQGNPSPDDGYGQPPEGQDQDYSYPEAVNHNTTSENYDQDINNPNYEQNPDPQNRPDQNPDNQNNNDPYNQDRYDSTSESSPQQPDDTYISTSDDQLNRVDYEPNRGDGGRLGGTDLPDDPSLNPELTVTSTSASSKDYEIPIFENSGETTRLPEVCPSGFLRCDLTRCIEKARICDGYKDCYDESDEADCPDVTCGKDDFRCNNGNCIEASRRCDSVYDCPDQEDERGCECQPDEFRCESDGICIEYRKQCDGVLHCADGSDERDCPCGPDQWQCDHGSCIKRKFRCDGRVDCPTDRSDERNCIANGSFRCRTGKFIHEYLRCNRQYDCPPGDFSDEQNCPCGTSDFKCDNGHCIPASKRCDRTHDCQDRSDERHCTYGTLCMAYEYKCKSGMCVPAEARCNGTVECDDETDEIGCSCKRDQYPCRDGSCINIAFLCNGHEDCSNGEDEYNCKSSCPPGQFTCQGGSNMCAVQCNGQAECDGGEDEVGCREDEPEACVQRCDGKCILEGQICDRNWDCADGSDEYQCNYCNGPEDFSCDSGDCIPFAQKCNDIQECLDGSDEKDCNYTMITNSQPCDANQFTCLSDQTCIDMHFYCDNNKDCNDGSDESNCQCPMADSWQCRDGECITSAGYCDGISDCGDGSDEADCPFTTQQPYVPPTTYRTPEEPRTEKKPDARYGACRSYEWRCENGPCIDAFRRCDGHIDCPFDYSDEFDCPPNSPITLNLQTYPSAQSIRHASTGGDVVFQCREEGPLRARVKWHREGRPIKDGSTDIRGRLEMFKVTSADSGVYICRAEEYANHPGGEARVTLQVDSPPVTSRPFLHCQPYEATCGNGQCIPKSAVCNNKVDCSDGSDEENCHHGGMCEPNEFKCNNRKCVLKTWLCDSEDDCGDGSDEHDCGPKIDGQCLPVEYTCKSQDQCIPKSFHCDDQTDCLDGSDEIGCIPIYVTSPPQPSNLKLNPGETLTLTAKAAGNPMPLISWRLNWGHVPAKCTSTSQNGIGVLVCTNMQPEDSGAYSAEAINNKGTTFATPDAIVVVSKTDLCPRGYFNNEARSENECIRCFCFGKSTQCRSADLFTYNMPTPLGEGGTRLIGIKASRSSDVNIDTQPISNQYFYQPLRNGATVTKSGDISSWSNSHPYLTLPEMYNGNQLKSYGGHIKYTLSPQTQNYGYDDSAATIIIKGKYGNLFHINRSGGTRDINIEARLTPEDWSKYPDGSAPASREDIMMVLDDIEMILLRADLNNAGVNITDFAMESAELLNVGLGAASLVEECTCPKGYEGLSCQKCASGFVRKKVGPWLGNCEREECPPGTYGDPSSSMPCKPCPCPLTNSQNQFARTCSLGPDGSVICDCFTGYEGNNCERCAEGYEGNPLLVGNTCQPKKSDNCNPIGTKSIRPPDECVCKDNAHGRYCEQCKNNSFFLSEDFRHGCALCFCSGVTQQCMSSSYRRKTTTVQFNVPQIIDQVKIYNSAPAGLSGSVRYSAPKETDLKPQLQRGEITLNVDRSSRNSVYYWSMPASFAGDKVTAYGGFLRYMLKNVPSSVDPRYRNSAPDVQLISDNQLTFHYFGDFGASHDRILNASIQFLEKGWQRQDGKEVTRQHFLLALADVKTILIKATYAPGPQVASPVSASIETAEPDAYGPTAYHVEQCVCPQGYIGTSCEECAPGYTRSSTGLYLEHCEPCECNGKATMCHPETGVCHECADNTDGDQCETCKLGYDRDPYGNCVEYRGSTSRPCFCDPRGTSTPCDSAGNCICKQNVEGDSCDRCRPGTFGLDSNNPNGCLSCYCSGVTIDCHEGNHYTRMPIAAPVLGEDYGGFTITDLKAERVIKDNFSPLFEQSELMYNFQFRPDVELYWSIPVLPGNRVLSYGGSISLRQKFSSENDLTSERGTDVVLDGGDISIFWTNPKQFQSGVSYTYQVPLKEDGWYILNTATPASRSDFMNVLRNLKRVLVRATVAQFIYETTIADVSIDTAIPSYDSLSPVAKGIEICMCPPGYMGTSCENCKTGYYKDQLGYCRECSCNGHDCQLDSSGQVVCNCQPPYTGYDCSTIGGEPSVTEPSTRAPTSEPTVSVTIISPTIKIQEVGSSVNFTCQAQSRNTRSRLPVTWTKSDGELPLERTYIDDYYGELQITNLQVSDSGLYICETSDGINTAQATATLRVPGNEMTLPTVEISPSVMEYYEGDRIELECRVKGNPTPTITWQRGSNRPLPLLSENQGYWFIIDSARVEDTGEYRCIASNTVGSDHRTAMVTVRARPSEPSRELLTVSNTSPSVEEGQSIRIVCTGTTNVPAGSIDWVRQDNAVFMSNVRSENGVLYIDYAEPDNQGVYICQSPLTNISPIPILVTVITANPVPEVYNISVSVDRLTLPTGGSGTVDCNPVGRPLPLIRWSKHGGGSFGPQSSQRGNTLIINNAQESDQGYYVCEGTVNGNPVANIYVFVEIERREPPSVDIWPQGEQSIQLGGQYELHCRVLGGIPEPDVTWNRNGGRALSSSTQIQPHNVLKFNRIEVNDEGEYTCTAHNDAGTVSASAVLKVRSPPEITITPSNYLQINKGSPLNVECRANGYPEPMVSISFNDNELVPPQPGHASLYIPSASNGDSGYYTCTASSVAGSIKDQFAVDVESRGDGGDDGGEQIPNNEGSGDYPDNTDNPDLNNEVPSNLYAIEGQPETIIYCNESGNVRWDRADNMPMSENIYQSGTRLVIRNVAKSDSGLYVCNIYDEYGYIHHAIHTSLVVVAAPTITLVPPTQTVQPGQSPTVECIVHGDDIIDTNWRPYDREAPSRMETRGNKLIFHHIEVEDAGKYECIARSQYANRSAIAEVIVSEDSDRKLVSHDNEQWAHAGSAVHLGCNLTQPNTRIVWTKDGRPVPRSVARKSDGSLFLRLAHKSDTGRYVCSVQDVYGRVLNSNYIDLHIQGPRDAESQQLLYIEQAPSMFRVGDNVDVLCRTKYRDVRVHWLRPGTNQYVNSVTYGDGAKLEIQSVTNADAGVYRCVGSDSHGRSSSDEFELRVESGLNAPSYSDRFGSSDMHVAQYTARLRDSIDLPCQHNLEPPVNIEWRREFLPLPAELRPNQPILRFDSVSETDAGTYVCRVSNSRTAVEAIAIFTVEGVVPRFEGESYIALPTLKDAFRQFEIEISFKPMDENGLILYNSQNQGRSGDYIALQLKNGVPEFIMNTGTETLTEVKYDKPLQLNVWHTIRIRRIDTKVTMDVDNSGPFVAESPDQWAVLDLQQPLYIGGVPDYDQLPVELAGASGLIACVSMVILGREEKNIMMDSLEQSRISECNTCIPNLCQNNAFCQEYRNERGYVCNCAPGFAGLNCDRTGEACRPGICGPGKCTDTETGYKCACPVTHTGRNCEVKQSIEYPAFTGSAYYAIKSPGPARTLTMSMDIKAATPVTDGIIMYCAESSRGYGGFTSLAVHDGRLEFRYDLAGGSQPIVLVSNKTLPSNEWTNVHIARIGSMVSMKINSVLSYEQRLPEPYNQRDLPLETPLFVGGVDESYTLNKNTGVTGGFNGCIKNLTIHGQIVNIVNQTIQSANVQECASSSDSRGDIPEGENMICQCRNGGECISSSDPTTCSCPPGYTGQFCEQRAPLTMSDPCLLRPCRNGGTCRPNLSAVMNHTCDCPLGFAGLNCQIAFVPHQSVGFNGNGYIELPASKLSYENLDQEPALIAMSIYTNYDGVLLYQKEAQNPPGYGDYILLRIERGIVVLDWDLGGGKSTVAVNGVFVNDGERHQIIAMLMMDGRVDLSVDTHHNTGTSTGISSLMNADSNIYIGGIPDSINTEVYPGFNGCIEQLELMDSKRGLKLGEIAVASRNAQRCSEPRTHAYSYE